MYICNAKHVRKYLCVTSITFFILLIYIFFLPNENQVQTSLSCPRKEFYYTQSNLPIVKLYGVEEEDNKLDIIKSLFTKLGYKIVLSDTKKWEVLWSHTYPFYSLKNELGNLKHYQKVNHFPGSGYITQKSNLALLSIDHIPKSFVLPSNKRAFIEYAKDNKNVFWVLKSSNHRGIRILNGTENLNVEGNFIQEFIKNPLLINGKKFDIGVYVILTSIDPLRVYMYSGDILLRFCKENYFPFNIDSSESYVVGDDYLPVWMVPDLRFFYSELNYTAKESLNAYLHSKGKSYKILWYQIEKTIQDVYFSVEENIKGSTLALGSLRNFFELVRFDFIADEYLNVYLLEVNMSPNLSPAHFSENKLLYEQIVFNSLHIVGLVRKFHDIFFYKGEAEVSEKDIQVNSEYCMSFACQNSCKKSKCKVCNHCMDREIREIFKSAYVEFTNKGKFRRIVPIPSVKTSDKNYKSPVELSPMNIYMDIWFKGKCLQDSMWCL